MRVLFVIESLDAGSGRHVVDLATGLAQRGVEMTVAYATHRANDALIAELQAARGVDLHAFRMRRAVSPRDALALFDLNALEKAKGPFDIIHGHSSKGGAAARLMRGRDAKRVYTPHAFRTLDPEIGGLAAKFYDGVERMLARRTDTVIVGSEPERRRAGAIGIPSHKVVKISNAMRPFSPNPQRAELRAALGLGDEAVCVGFVGRLEAQKHPELFLNSFHQALNQTLAINGHAVVIGDGSLRGALEAQAHELGLARRVHFLGAASGVEWMPAFDMLACSSRYESNVTYVWIEALFHGLPIVTTHVGDADLAVHQGESGFVVDVDDQTGLADGLAKLMGDAVRRAWFGGAALKRSTAFHLDVLLDAHLDLYEALLKGDRMAA